MKKGLLVVFLLAVVLFPVFASDEGLKIGDTTWKFNGEIRFMYTDQTSYDGYYVGYVYNFTEGTDSFNRMYQRYRFGITGEFNENLSAHYELQVGDEQWGNKNYNEREVNIRSLYAYIQYKPEFIAGTTVKVGLQGYDDIFQYSVWSDEGVGIITNYNNEKFNANFGYLTLRDDDVDTDVDPGDGLISSTDTLIIADMNYALMDGLTVKAAYYFENWQVRDSAYLDYYSNYLGFGADYQFNDSIAVGGHYVMNKGSADYNNSIWDLKGYFLFGYASYSKDKLSAKVNFGYTPYDRKNPSDPEDSTEVTVWHGAFPMGDGLGSSIYFARGNQWTTAYGLEYLGRGEVCDRQAVLSSYGDWPGLMVISFNLSYDFMYANFGIAKHTYVDEAMIGWEEVDKTIGSELDLGVKTEIMKGLQFKAVYAMFFAGEFWKVGIDEVELENGHEMSMLLQYNF